MEWLETIGRTLGFSLAAGVNLYATVAILGLASRYGWVALPEQFQIFDNPWIIGAAGVLYAVEFVADKIPWVDSIWDSVHTFIRPVGGAVIAVATLGEQPAAIEGAIALLGAMVAASSHVTKASTRVAANASPEPFSNWILSFLGDGFVIGITMIALNYPLIALGVSVTILVLIALIIRSIWKWLRATPKPEPTPTG